MREFAIRRIRRIREKDGGTQQGEMYEDESARPVQGIA